jgi:hypothetical protein
MKRNNHVNEHEVLECLAQKCRQTSHLQHNKHLETCTLCQDEVSSLDKVTAAVKTLKQSREERLNLLVKGVTSELNTTKKRSALQIPAAAAAVVLLAFGIYFASANLDKINIKSPNSLPIRTAVFYSASPEQSYNTIKTQSIRVAENNSQYQTTSQAICSTVLHEGEGFDYVQSQENSLSVSSNYLSVSYSTSF